MSISPLANFSTLPPTLGLSDILLFYFLVVPFFIFLLGSISKFSSSSSWASPPRVPILGSIPFIKSKHFPQQCLDWSHQYGSIFSLKLGTSNPSLVVSGHDLAKELFIDHGYAFTGRANPFFFHPELRLDEYFTPVMNTTPHVLSQRTLILSSTKASINSGLGNCIDRSSRLITSKLYHEASLEPIDIRHILLEAAAVCAINISYGFPVVDFDKIPPEARSILECADETFNMLQFFEEPTIAFPFLVKLLWKRTERIRKQARKTSSKLLEAYETLFQLAKTQYEVEGPDSLESSVIKSLFESGGSGMSQFQQGCLAGTTVAAAMSTTMNTIHSTLGCLAVHLDYQDQLRNEISKIVGADQIPSSEQSALRELPLLRAFIEEVIRMFPVFPILSRVAEQDHVMSNGQTIHEGQVLFVNYYGINRDSRVFRDPNAFNPYRFLESEKKVNSYWPKYGHASFGAGRRSCPGSEFAMNLILCTISRILHSFEIKFSDSIISPKIDLVEPVLVGVEQHTKFPKLIFKPLEPKSY
ncbi:cytochrome P450 monooxygenase [Melampsora larici-populina 98AG31]|uniref:Cytochrome P450 monooxygenase n=1 Tax=Melampsora larici-populina (strain 98AG31 / pathotype 3-4-7) TaxID=747676 RepID=F4RBA1_MELLP|nr:cytochrome P450 monooxygenase [Melampsora larici-populina 98AG31]EGG10395.1 cytochrome P450 monooxygenase [Melampsora larici-populina 98AG31]